jgi:glucose-6-phosphate isomerase
VTLTINPGTLVPALHDAYRRLTERRVAEALWRRRLDVWTSDAAVQQQIATRLGWLEAPAGMRPQLPRLQAFAASIPEAGFTDIVLLGMGGSSLAPEVLRRVIGVAPGFPRFHVLDSVDPDTVRRAMERAATSLFVLASKSGSTIEPNVMAAEATRRIRDAGIADVGSRFVAITDPQTALHRRALDERFRDVFVNPSDIGGRYSALSLFGLVPAALMGIDVDALLDRADAMADACRADDPEANPGLALGALMAAAAAAGRDKLTLLLPDRLEALGLWVEQLVAESTGKHGKGVVPIAGEAPGQPYASDRALVAVTFGGDEPAAAVLERARTDGTPVATMAMTRGEDLGAEFFRWEFATAVAGLLLDINPFDEPNVQQAKDATRALLDVYAREQKLPIPEPHAGVDAARLTVSASAQRALGDRSPAALLELVRPGDYVGVLAFLPPDDDRVDAILRQARAAIGARTACATMLGYGPRYLHSTGQLHKGGANNGVFLVVAAETSDDLAIPGERFSFGVLEMAQAIGDFQSLDRTGRRAMLIHLPTRDPERLRHVLETLLKAST